MTIHSSQKALLALFAILVPGPLLGAACHSHAKTLSSPTASIGVASPSRPLPRPAPIEVVAQPPTTTGDLSVDGVPRETPTLGRWRFELLGGVHRFELRTAEAMTIARVEVRADEPTAVLISTLPSAAEKAPVRKREYSASLTPEQLSDIVQRHEAELARCADNRSGARAELRRAVTATVVVRSAGSVASVVTRGAPFGELTDCIGLTIASWRFPEAADESEFGFPVIPLSATAQPDADSAARLELTHERGRVAPHHLDFRVRPGQSRRP
ncbi:MAG: hypothetical protein JWN48_763 [Myxococcaceae bacterium]|nr:hypothetical protein [Myxococcaceae bacterium]